MKKIITILIAIYIIISVNLCDSFSVKAAQAPEISIEFGPSPDMSEISARIGDNITEPTVIEESGKSVWHIGSTVWYDENLYLDINDSFVNNMEPFEDVYLDIEYYDETQEYRNLSCFEVKYIDASGAEARSDEVFGQGSKKYVVSTLKLTDPQLNNSFSGSDFILTTRLSKQGYAGQGVKISKITVRAGETKSPVTAKVTTDKLGNIMYDTDEEKAFKCTVTNRTGKETEVSYVLNIIDENANVIETHNGDITADIGNTAFYINYDNCIYGAFTAELTISDGNNSNASECPFSYNRYVDGENEKIGACVHLGGNDRDPINTLELLSNAGIGWIRTEMHWDKYETEKGVYKLSPYQKDCLENARKNNVKLYTILAFGNPLYTEGSGFPKTDEQLTAFYNYVYNLVTELERDYGDVIGAYELWNEPNLSEDISSGDYTKLAKVTRDAMDAANSDRELVGLCMSGIHDENCCKWCEDACAAGLGEYVDGISFHPYWTTTSPEDFGLNNYIEKFRQLSAQYGGKTKIWISEHGWPTDIGVAERTQAMFLVRSFLMSMSDRDFGTYFIYQFQDGWNDPYDAEAQYGLIRPWDSTYTPYAAKKSYAAVANMNYWLKGMDFSKHTAGTAYDTYRFENNDDGSYVDVVYNKFDTIASYTPQKSKEGFSLAVYDMYGNEIKDTSTIKVNGEPVYAVYKKEFPDTTPSPVPSVVRAEQTEKYGSVKISGHRDGETGVDFIVLKGNKTYADFLSNPAECTAYFNTVTPQDGSFDDEFYITNAIGKMNIVIHYHSDNTYEKKNFDLTNKLVIEESGDNIDCTVDYSDDVYDAYVAQYKQGILKEAVRLNSAKESVAKVRGADKIKAFLWEKDTMKPLCSFAELAIRNTVFINAGISDSYTFKFDGISDDETVGVMIYSEDTNWNDLQSENISADDIIYFNELPVVKNKYNGEYTFDRCSGLYRLQVSDFTGAELNNTLVMYSNPNENKSAMTKLLTAAKLSEAEMVNTAKEYRYALLLYYPNISENTDEAALKSLYSYINSNELTSADGSIIADTYKRYVLENK